MGSTEVHYIDIEHGLLTGKSAVVWRPGQQLTLPLPDGREVAVTLTRTEARGPDRFVAHGEIPGVPEGRFVMAVLDQHVAVSLDGLTPAEFKVRTLGPTSAPTMQLYALDAAAAPVCGALVPSADLQSQAYALGLAGSSYPSAAAAEPLTSGEAVVDLLVAYSPDTRIAVGSSASIINQIDLGVAKVQSDLENSGVIARIRLVGTMETDLNESAVARRESGWQADALEKLTATQDGYLDEVHARRDELGADLVSWVVSGADSSSSGIAYLMQGLEAFNSPFFGFSVVNYANMSDGQVLSHELGHNFGCAHDRENAGTSGGIYDYSYGFRAEESLVEGGTGRVRTIMSYTPGTRVRYFSNPDISLSVYVNAGRSFNFVEPVTLGIEEGQDGESDNARTIGQTAFQVANYRLAPDRSDAGRLVNVSTRAWVGSGDQALIGGFVLGGDEPKQILVRAPGPTIGAAPFNVPDALADPLLSIDQFGVGSLAANDNWGTPAANGVAVAAAAQTAGAFAFPNGSLDAGTVLELSPGNYTASVIGKGGAEGYGLVEVYEVNAAGSSRLLNLSTRGYADSDRPMVAGFVVNADPGEADQRKTMFIRVRGPSLANYGLPESSVMPDPVIEIYDANAALVYYNDDWDPPSSDIDGTNRDGIPLLRRGMVDQLSEQAVFDAAQAVGATDMEPVEPGVVIELPPGIYTVFVMPFEALPNQPAEPGIAIVEVFEIAR